MTITKQYLPSGLFLVALAMLTLSSGCSQRPTKTDESGFSQSMTHPQTQSPELIIAQSLTALEPTKSTLLLQAAQLYWQRNLIGQSKAAIIEITAASLSNIQLQDFLSLRQQIAIYEDDLETLETLLPLYDAVIMQSPIETQVNAIENKIAIFDTLDFYIPKAILLAESSGLMDEEELSTLPEKIWSTLRQADTSDILQHNYQGSNYDVLGWLDLARAFKLNQTSLDLQLSAVNNWLESWPMHPAALIPPKEITVLRSLPDFKPKQIVLALPLSGPLAKAGQSVRDGFFAEFYKQSRASQQTDTTIQLFDTHQNNIESLYRAPSHDNTLIVGPLDKTSLAQLARFDEIPITTLALNTLSNAEPKENLYQFTLQPESGTKQIAERLYNKGLKRVVIISPEAEWGLRIHDAFLEEFRALNGFVIDSVFYNDQASLSEHVAKLLGTHDSKIRRRTISNITGLRLENEPRRRKDIDAIFMIAKPKQARLLKPLFAYHYAAGVPVYSSSQIHDPKTANHDLNGTEFVEMPWMLSSTDHTKNQIQTLLSDTADSFSRFYALGADAYKLSPRLKLLAEIPDSQVEGQTGLLSLNQGGEIERELQWAKFYRGKAIPIRD